MNLPLVFDLGMFDGSDTRYYLETGHRVIALDANPVMINKARSQLDEHIKSGQLTVVNAAIAPKSGEVELTLNVDNPAGSAIGSIDSRHFAAGTVKVPAVTMADVLAMGNGDRPKYIKIDIEGHDAACVRAIPLSARPDFLSCELSEDTAEDIIRHCKRVLGFSLFKIIDQTLFRSIDRRSLLRDRLASAIVRRVGYAEPQYVRRSGRLFQRGTSAGPAPWASDGHWRSADEIIELWKRKNTKGRNVWFDLQAC